MKPKLSIIIPCYNCASTLTEAVTSCFNQKLELTTFEIIMVDDGSTDATRTVMEKLATKYANIELIFHPENRGGGAARNTGIRASHGDIIYCLDSDNFFAPESVSPMLQYLNQHQLDGVVYYERRFFSDKKHKNYQVHINDKPGANINIQDIFSLKSHILLDNFFYTRASYDATSGYPEHHGFDTQCFELRFLAAGHRVQIVPASVFYHRQDAGQNSYFQRVYKQGYFSRNFYLICEDIIYLFSRSTRQLIMGFNVFQNSKLDSSNLKAALDQKLQAQPNDFLIPEHQTYQTPTGRADWLKTYKHPNTPEDDFALAVMLYQDGHYIQANSTYLKLLEQGVDSEIIYFNILRISLALTKKYEQRKIEDVLQRLVINLNPKPQSLSRLTNLVNHGIDKLHTLLK